MKGKRILQKIFNIFKIIFASILNLFHVDKKEEKDIDKKDKKEEKLESRSIQKVKKIENIDASLPLPDDKPTKRDNHDDDDSSPFILDLPKVKKERIKSYINTNTKVIFTNKYIEELVDNEIEEYYKEEKLKIKDTTKEIEEKIKEFKKKIIPIINIVINDKDIQQEEVLKKEIKEIVEDELELNPIIEKEAVLEEKETEYTNEPITVEKPLEKPKKDAKPIVKEAIATTAAIGATAIIGSVDSVREIIIPKEEKPKIKKEDKIDTIEEIKLPELKSNIGETIKEQEKEEVIEPIELPEIKEEIELPVIKEEPKGLDAPTPPIEEETTEEKVEEVIEKIEEEVEEIVETNINIDKLTKETDQVIDESKKETKKEEFEDKDYDRINKQLDDMINKLSDTYIKYEDKLSDKQKEKLKKQEARLNDTKDKTAEAKKKDLEQEEKLLEENIKQSEIEGLKNELSNMEVQNNIDHNNHLLKDMDKLDATTKKQLREVDKRIIMKRFRKASMILEMKALLALPFVRNKYFAMFTAGLIVDNHFNFISAYLRRKQNKYEPPELENINKGKDALIGALDITYKNMVQLEALEEQILEKYPELEKDPRYINQITSLKLKLTSTYDKLLAKSETMDKYFNKSKKQTKILHKKKKDE
jgi:hypothetical protein